jgi:hypothetical protein
MFHTGFKKIPGSNQSNNKTYRTTISPFIVSAWALQW